jgi:ectoine hydroxylase-related dioxygenase (phytanoyl-CoA dioxygenase family)
MAAAGAFTVAPSAVEHYRAHGWCIVEDAVPPEEVARIKLIVERMLSGEIDTRRNRADLGGHVDRVQPLTENIIQIAWPTDLTSALDENLFIQRSRAISDQLYGDEKGTWALDMNQILVKQPHTDTDTPLHQDQSCAWPSRGARARVRASPAGLTPLSPGPACKDYIKLEDQRACNLWLALVDVSPEMGCLWFEDSPLAAPAALRPHFGAGRGTGALQCAGDAAQLVASGALAAAPLRAGSITVHSHLTPHYAAGNTTDRARLGYVVQTRPAAAVREARMRGFDHGRNAGNSPGERAGMLEKIEAGKA